ncbi:MAG TPA: nucleoside-diphosphate sugar epimerase/dehydratase [Planctomycetota bacterium]|nr:nucleoside-diphosphate sugar epimerase/dehydratase [Planctomycetota bacterium]
MSATLRAVLIQHRTRIIALAHLTLFALAYWAAFMLRFDFGIEEYYRQFYGRTMRPAEAAAAAAATSAQYWLIFIKTLGPVLIAKLIIFYAFRLYQGWWRYVGLRDLIHILGASLLAMLVVTAWGFLLYRKDGFPRSVPFLDCGLTVFLIGGARAGMRLLREGPSFLLRSRGGHKIFIAGAGDAGESLLREVDRNPAIKYDVVGFLDDDPNKIGARIHGVPVLGSLAQAGELAERYSVREVLIAMPSASGRQMREVVRSLQGAGLKCTTLPGMDELIGGQVSFSNVRPVNINDLLGREPANLDLEAVGRFLTGKVVMVTGAGGSIGSEICRQVLRFGPAELVLVERTENSLFHIDRELRGSHPAARVTPCLADIGDVRRMERIFTAHQPRVVFHAAAHKHVPMLEYNPGEAVKNNILGTKLLADLAARLGAEAFVMVSTDKAVRPANVMGAAKRLAEVYVQSLAASGRTKFVTVRFGNVIGSEGSAIPIFQQQIAAGGPVTVTHPEVRRYFMTIPEASQLVLQAGAMGRGGEIFVLNMGEPVLIRELAEQLIRLSGLEPGEDIDIVYTGLRPGEKLYEELRLDEECVAPTPHPKITVLRASPGAEERLRRTVDSFQELARLADELPPAELRERILKLVPESVC